VGTFVSGRVCTGIPGGTRRALKLAETEAGETAAILFTSGSNGRVFPRGQSVRHGNLRRRAKC
jgi:hypothetical protein